MTWPRHKYPDRWTFIVRQGEVTVQDICVLRSGRNFAAIEVATSRKHPEILSYSGSEICLHWPGRPAAGPPSPEPPEATVICWPRQWAGWDVIGGTQGRYSLRFALVRPRKAHRLCPVRAITGDQLATLMRGGTLPKPGQERGGQ